MKKLFISGLLIFSVFALNAQNVEIYNIKAIAREDISEAVEKLRKRGNMYSFKLAEIGVCGV